MRKRAVYASFKKRLGASSPGAIIGVIALVLALTGGAYAASGALTGKQKKEVKAIAKQFAGKPGAQGATGPTGPQGSPGAKGDTGGQGPKGDEGDPGDDGAAGESPEITFEGASVCAPNGGVVYEVPGSGEEAEICNGEEGSPWTAGGTLPPGATLTGAWGTSGEGRQVAPISFAIPLAAPITDDNIYASGEANFSTECLKPGVSINKPKAPPGVLCIYRGEGEASGLEVFQLDGGSENEASVSGAQLFWDVEPESFIVGSYSVTGCDPVPTNPFPCPTP